MLKVNLEKELIRQNKSIVSAKELLLLNEYERLGEDIASDDILKRVFGETSAHEGKKVKDRATSLKNDTLQFNQSRVFHISQIEKLCKKYHLRFLPSCYFKGSIDKETPNKISQFEIATGRRCSEWQSRGDTLYDRLIDRQPSGGNTYIVAPASSFELQEKPKDPLLFYQINSEYYYLIHKWGSDISLIRRFYSLLSNSAFCSFLILASSMWLIIYLFSIGVDRINEKVLEFNGFGVLGVCLSLGFMICFITSLIEPWIRFIKKNEWNSAFKS